MSVCKSSTAFLAAVGSGLLLTACGPAPAPSAPPPPKVTLLVAAESRVAQSVLAPGLVEGVREVEIRARVTGVLKTVEYREGARVKAGDILFRIDPDPYAAAVALAQAQLRQESARAAQASAEAARQEKLFAQKAASEKERLDAVAARDAAVAAHGAAGARLRLAELDLGYCEVRSPVDGVAGRRLRTEGALVNHAGPDGLLTTVVSSDEVWVRFGVSESDHARLFGGASGASGAEVRLTLADGAAHPVAGRVDFSAPEVDGRLGNVQLRARFDNAKGGLMAGQFVRARVTGRPVPAVLVPQTALVQTPQGRAVFVLGAGDLVEARVVTLGDVQGADVAVLSGLKPGDRVVLDQLQRLRPGSKVTVAR
ncbi:MAG: efflux RND transporter periplasmic adaptor subunit [Opitutia bacterium]